MPYSISFTLPNIWQNHNNITYGPWPRLFYDCRIDNRKRHGWVEIRRHAPNPTIALQILRWQVVCNKKHKSQNTKLSKQYVMWLILFEMTKIDPSIQRRIQNNIIDLIDFSLWLIDNNTQSVYRLFEAIPMRHNLICFSFLLSYYIQITENTAHRKWNYRKR